MFSKSGSLQVWRLKRLFMVTLSLEISERWTVGRCERRLILAKRLDKVFSFARTDSLRRPNGESSVVIFLMADSSRAE